MITKKEDLRKCYAVRADKEVFELFMDKCEGFGLVWVGGNHPRELGFGEAVVFSGIEEGKLTHGSEVGMKQKGYKRLTLSDLKARTRTEYEKVTESIWELRGQFERGELYCKHEHAREYAQVTNTQTLAQALHGGFCYRKVEKEIDWRDEVNKAFPAIDFRDLDSHNSHDLGRWQPDKFLELCRVALRANGEIE